MFSHMWFPLSSTSQSLKKTKSKAICRGGRWWNNKRYTRKWFPHSPESTVQFPLKGGNFPQEEPITCLWCMIVVIQWLMKMEQMFWNPNIHLVSSFHDGPARMQHSWKGIKRYKKCSETLMELNHTTWEGNCSPDQGEHISSNQTPTLLIWLMVTVWGY